MFRTFSLINSYLKADSKGTPNCKFLEGGGLGHSSEALDDEVYANKHRPPLKVDFLVVSALSNLMLWE